MRPLLRLSEGFSLAMLLSAGAGCASADYKILDRSGRVIQHVSASSLGGDSFVTVVYYGGRRTPVINAGGDSTALVDATARAGREAIQLALKAAK